MTLLLFSLLAGVLTILAPCVLPLLPVIIGRTSLGSMKRVWAIILSFAVSILFFTLLLKRIVLELGIRPEVLTKVSGIILLVFGVFMLFPGIWQRVMVKTGIEKRIQSSQSKERTGFGGDILLGFSLGPIFNSCSPTYAVLVATILPQSFSWGLVNILAYIVGLCAMLFLIAWGGRAIVQKMRRAANPSGWFKKILAILLIVVGVAVLTGSDKKVETWLLQNKLFLDTTKREQIRAIELRNEFKESNK